MDYGWSSFLHTPFQPSNSNSNSNSLTKSASACTAELTSWEFQYEDPFTASIHQSDSLYASLNIIDHHFPDYQVCGMPSSESSSAGSAITIGSQQLWSDTIGDAGVALRQHQIQQQSVLNAPVKNDLLRARRTGRKRSRDMRGCHDSASKSNNSVAELLTWEMISQYFYMPIARAAEKLNVGLTLFKKRCRELEVGRWPHRKLMSIKSLINNVQAMEEGGVNPAVDKATIQSAIQELERQRKMMETMPDVELEAQTKRLRQACFKANYKKRRLMIMNNEALAESNGSASSSSSKDHESTTSSIANVYSSSSSMPGINEAMAHCFDENDVLQSLLLDELSPSECTLLNDFI